MGYEASFVQLEGWKLRLCLRWNSFSCFLLSNTIVVDGEETRGEDWWGMIKKGIERRSLYVHDEEGKIEKRVLHFAFCGSVLDQE